MENQESRPSIRSAWPTPIGKKLTNHKISKYKKQGYYATNIDSFGQPVTRRDKAKRKMSSLLADLA